jgi:hypothetical protein
LFSLRSYLCWQSFVVEKKSGRTDNALDAPFASEDAGAPTLKKGFSAHDWNGLYASEGQVIFNFY